VNSRHRGKGETRRSAIERLSRRLTGLALAALSLAACRTEREPKALSQTPDTAAGERDDALDARALAGVWYGVTDDGVSQRAWVLSLELAPMRGFFYSALSGAELCDVRVETTGRITWNTGSAFGRVMYAFDGRHSADGLRGMLRRTSSRGDTVSADLALRRVQASAQVLPSGVYSSMRYSEDSGDLLGTDLLLLEADSLIGALTIAEGAPGEPQPLLDARRDGDTLRFAIQTTSFDRAGAPVREPKLSFTALFARTSVHLQQSDAVEGEVLTRRGGVGEFLRRQPTRRCP
jgi:hypothetical protein